MRRNIKEVSMMINNKCVNWCSGISADTFCDDVCRLQKTEMILKRANTQLAELTARTVKAERELDLTWHAISCVVDDWGIRKLKEIYSKSLRDYYKQEADK